MGEFLFNIKSINRNFTLRRLFVSRKTLKHRGLARAIDSEQCEALSIIQAKGNSLYCEEWVPEQGSVSFSEVIDSDDFICGCGNSNFFLDDIVIKFKCTIRFWDFFDREFSFAKVQLYHYQD